MKTKFLIGLTLILASSNIHGQDIRVVKNFVIAIDDNVAVYSIARPQLVIKKQGSPEEFVSIGYIPGDLYFTSEEDKNKVLSDSVDNIILRFNNYEYKRGVQTTQTYQIELNKKWLDYSFIVLRLSSAHKNNPSKEGYIYSFDFPGYSIVPIRKGNMSTAE